MSKSKIDELKIQAKLLQKRLAASGEPISLGQALDQIAVKNGEANWRAYKRRHDVDELMYPKGFSRMLNHWFASYEEGRRFLDGKPGMWLLPYGSQCFACEQEFIGQLGILAGDKLLEMVGHDWVKPLDAGAWERLLEKLRVAKEIREKAA